MSDNIRNFNDYRKKVNSDKQETEEINIEIQDPLDFLSASEREEYYRTQHEKMDAERQKIDKDSEDYFFDDDFEVTLPEEQVPARKNNLSGTKEDNYMDEDEEIPERKKTEKSKSVPGKTSGRMIREHADKRIENRPQKNEADEEWYDEDEGRSSAGIDPYLVVRIASIVTGILILVLIGLIVKVKVVDTLVKGDPDEEINVSVGEVAGYTTTNDTVVTTVALNLRSTPSTESDTFIVTNVPAGTELSRVGISDDGFWAQVEYEGQRLYCAMKYLTVKE